MLIHNHALPPICTLLAAIVALNLLASKTAQANLLRASTSGLQPSDTGYTRDQFKTGAKYVARSTQELRDDYVIPKVKNGHNRVRTYLEESRLSFHQGGLESTRASSGLRAKVKRMLHGTYGNSKAVVRNGNIKLRELVRDVLEERRARKARYAEEMADKDDDNE